MKSKLTSNGGQWVVAGSNPTGEADDGARSKDFGVLGTANGSGFKDADDDARS